MYLIIFYVIPLIVMWKKREEGVADTLFSLYGTMIGVYLAVWSGPLVRSALAYLPYINDGGEAWMLSGCMILVWLLVTVIFRHAVQHILPEGFEFFSFPDNWTRHLSKLFVFWNASLIISLLTAALISSPAAALVPFISNDQQIRSAVRYRILWNSFGIDRFSMQPVTVNMRRSAMDFYVSETASGPEMKNSGEKKNNKKNSGENGSSEGKEK